MTWEALHGGTTVYGKRVGKVGKLGGTQGLPDQDVFNQLLDKAQGLTLADADGDGMTFTWATATVHKAVVSLGTINQPSSLTRKSAAICHEDRVFPVDPGGHLALVIRQSLAPCIRCRAAFRAWAKQRASTIVVSADTGYDAAADNTVFIFTSTGAVYQWS